MIDWDPTLSRRIPTPCALRTQLMAQRGCPTLFGQLNTHLSAGADSYAGEYLDVVEMGWGCGKTCCAALKVCGLVERQCSPHLPWVFVASLLAVVTSMLAGDEAPGSHPYAGELVQLLVCEGRKECMTEYALLHIQKTP